MTRASRTAGRAVGSWSFPRMSISASAVRQHARPCASLHERWTVGRSISQGMSSIGGCDAQRLTSSETTCGRSRRSKCLPASPWPCLMDIDTPHADSCAQYVRASRISRTVCFLSSIWLNVARCCSRILYAKSMRSMPTTQPLPQHNVGLLINGPLGMMEHQTEKKMQNRRETGAPM